jgi:hypothetical protein
MPRAATGVSPDRRVEERPRALQGLPRRFGAGNFPRGITFGLVAAVTSLPDPNISGQQKTRRWRVVDVLRRGKALAAPPSRSHLPTAGGYRGTPSPSFTSAYAEMLCAVKPYESNVRGSAARKAPRRCLTTSRLTHGSQRERHQRTIRPSMRAAWSISCSFHAANPRNNPCSLVL